MASAPSPVPALSGGEHPTAGVIADPRARSSASTGTSLCAALGAGGGGVTGSLLFGAHARAHRCDSPGAGLVFQQSQTDNLDRLRAVIVTLVAKQEESSRLARTQHEEPLCECVQSASKVSLSRHLASLEI